MVWGRKPKAESSAEQLPGDRIPDAEAPGALHLTPERLVDRRALPKQPRPVTGSQQVRVATRRSKSARHPMIIAGNAVFTGLILLALVAGVGVIVGKQKLEAKGPLDADKIVNVPRSGVRDVADVLEHEGVIGQQWLFVAGALLQRSRGEMKSGEYQFSKQASVQDVINTMIEGKVLQHAITIPEGLTSEQIVQRLLDTDVLAGNIREIPREGSLMPETYRFPRGTPREQVIQRMQQAQHRVLQESWDRRASDLPLKTPDDLLTLASIVEKETGKPEERSRVAAVFVNRIKQHIRLQSDPTIIYGLVGGKGTLGRPIMRSEIMQATPYNTYVINGLPPGPIANPGRASIEATANPARTKEIYFVADGTGGHTFSETLDQHQKSVAKLRAIERVQNDSSIGATADEPSAAEQPGAPGNATPRPRSARAVPAPRAAPAPAATPPAAPPASAQAAPQTPPRPRVQTP